MKINAKIMQYSFDKNICKIEYANNSWTPRYKDIIINPIIEVQECYVNVSGVIPQFKTPSEVLNKDEWVGVYAYDDIFCCERLRKYILSKEAYDKVLDNLIIPDDYSYKGYTKAHKRFFFKKVKEHYWINQENYLLKNQDLTVKNNIFTASNFLLINRDLI